MPRSLKLYLIGVVALSAVALVATTLLIPPTRDIALPIGIAASTSSAAPMPPPPTVNVLMGIAFWIVITLLASASPVQLPQGSQLAVGIAPIIGALVLGGPTVAAWVAAIGVTELREVRGRIPWYGTLANHAGVILPAILGGLVRLGIVGDSPSLALDFVGALAGAAVFFVANLAMASTLVALRKGKSPREVVGDLRGITTSALALAPLAWLMARMYLVAPWATLLFALPLYTTRVAYHRFIEMREMFTQTIQSLANAVDKRDPFTANHSQRVMLIASDIGRQMKCRDAEMEALEWGGLLHDIGKIGVPDSVLLKQDKLTREERALMNRHPVIGANIIAHVGKLAPELPIIRHHHEWYNGSGYPDRLMGDEIPKLARVLHVADAFEAMTAQRPYRMRPLSREQAIAELRKYAGVQFDPVMVDAFVRTSWAKDVADAGRPSEARPVPLLAQAAARMIPPPAPGGPPADAS